MTELLIGRQPIFDRSMNVYAYELLYRSGQTNQAVFTDGDQATMQVIINALVEIGLDNIVGESKAFINLTRNFITGKYPIPLPSNRVVVEVLEDIQADAALLDSLQQVSQNGFTIALDDVADSGRVSQFGNLAQIVKLDLMQIDKFQLPEISANIKMHGLKLLAEKVETQAEYMNCRRLGFDYFQGYFLCKPNVIKGNKLDTSRMVIMQTIAKLQDPQISFSELETIISMDVSLTYKLLRMANSGYYALSSEVTSLRQAISMLGLDTIRGWMSLMMMSSLLDKPHELTCIALQRARMAENLARIYRQRQTEVYFLVGLFSVLDAMMDQPMAKLLDELKLSDVVTGALLRYEGLAGQILYGIQAYEKGDWETVMKLNVPTETMNRLYLDSVKWTNVLSKEIRAS